MRKSSKSHNLREIIELVLQADQPTSFNQAQDLFERIFGEVELRTEGIYSADEGSSGRGLYFNRFSQTSPFWPHKGNIKVLETNGQYVVFDDIGNFVVYKRNRRLFGEIILNKSTNDILTQYQGISITDNSIG
jgi:hypothetical protein